jgi:ABC-type sugar transport system ATPase subunit
VQPTLEARNLRKEFPGTVALADASMTVLPGTVHALLGENGAGKSTLLKIFAGIHHADSGELRMDGQPVRWRGPKDARDRGLVTIHQELSLVRHLSVAENIFLGAEPTRWGMPRFDRIRELSRELLQRVGAEVDPRTRVSELSIAEQQLVEIAKALRVRPRILSMDEPTAALSERESRKLFEVIRGLVSEGVSVLYVSHRLREVLDLCTSATVLRDGHTVAQLSMEGCTEEELVRRMVGRDVKRERRTSKPLSGKVTLEARNLTREGWFRDINLSVKAGEVVGIAGLVGAGRTSLLRALFGADDVDAGEVRVDGTLVSPGKPDAAVRAGMGFLTEDRKQQGLALTRGIRENATLSSLGKFSRWGVVRENLEHSAAVARFDELRVKAASPESQALTLSGGNQQKVVLSRWLIHGCKVFLFDEPTRGIDIGARWEIYEHIRKLADSGAAVLFVSSDLPEILSLSDRILVMSEGRISGELQTALATEESVLSLATPKQGAVHV